jgi:hypothetical protein
MSRGPLASKVLPVPLDLLDPPEQKEQLVLPALLAPPARQAPQDQLVRKVLRDSKALPVLRDLLAPLARPALQDQLGR